jgi:hypothetical protein
LDDGLENSVPTNEHVDEFLFFKKVTANLQAVKHAKAGVTYASVVLHTSGLGKDSPHHTTTPKASDICFDRKGGGIVETFFSASELELGDRWDFVTFRLGRLEQRS